MVLRLRPHHLESIVTYEKKGLGYKALFSFVALSLYGKKTALTFYDVIKRMKSGEGFQLIEGADELCLSCFYQESCLKGDYEEAMNMAPSFFLFIGANLPNTVEQDKKALRRLNLSFGTEYHLSDFL